MPAGGDSVRAAAAAARENAARVIDGLQRAAAPRCRRAGHKVSSRAAAHRIVFDRLMVHLPPHRGGRRMHRPGYPTGRVQIARRRRLLPAGTTQRCHWCYQQRTRCKRDCVALASVAVTAIDMLHARSIVQPADNASCSLLILSCITKSRCFLTFH